MKILTYTSVLLLCTIACNVGNPQSGSTAVEQSVKPFSFIDQPLKKLGPALLSFVFSNSKGFLHKTNKGSLIMIPKDAFVNEDGSLVQGDVTIDFKEIFTPSEIILSGIPMNVKQKGVVTPFISDGMFSIVAGCNGTTVKLAEGKSISVSTPSNKADADFDYWYFNEVAGEWEKTGDRNTTLSAEAVLAEATAVNPELAANFKVSELKAAPPRSETQPLAETETAKPLAPESQSDKDFVFNIKADYSEYPELAGYKHVLWKPEADLNENEQRKLGQDMQASGANVALNCLNEDDQVYEIAYGSKRIKARPVYIGADKEKAVAKYQNRMKAYNAEMRKIAEAAANAQKSQEQYQKTYSLFQVTQMGIYNCDRFYSYKGQKNDYRFQAGDLNADQYVFAVLSGNQGVIALSAAYKVGDVYKLPSAEIIGFVHTTPNGEVYAASHDGQGADQKNVVQLTRRVKSLDSPDALQDILKNL